VWEAIEEAGGFIFMIERYSLKANCKRRLRKWKVNKKNMRVRTAAILLMENSKEISVLNATKLTGNVLNVDSSSRLQYRRTHAHNAMRSAIFLTLLAIPRNAEAPDILIQGYSGKSIYILMIQSS
jgi:ferredoxin-fold anticodon binding domain-containing protein